MPQHQYSLSLIHHEVDSSVIEQRASDGYINATALCQAGGKRFNDYARLTSTIEFAEELATAVKIPLTDLIQAVSGGVPHLQGTWVHPQMAIHLGQWVSAKFAVQVSSWVRDWMSGHNNFHKPAELPAHLDRYLKNDGNVPPGYFSVLQETGLSLFGPLHNLGFDVPKGWVPDISVGKAFCAWLRQEKDIDTDALPTYSHDYLDGRQLVFPKLYPEIYLPEFRNWFRTIWLPVNGMRYFKQKDPGSLTYLDKLPALAGPKKTANLPNWRKSA